MRHNTRLVLLEVRIRRFNQPSTTTTTTGSGGASREQLCQDWRGRRRYSLLLHFAGSNLGYCHHLQFAAVRFVPCLRYKSGGGRQHRFPGIDAVEQQSRRPANLSHRMELHNRRVLSQCEWRLLCFVVNYGGSAWRLFDKPIPCPVAEHFQVLQRLGSCCSRWTVTNTAGTKKTSEPKTHMITAPTTWSECGETWNGFGCPM
jgi:hypothetical protein